jgi:hypothetical protein
MPVAADDALDAALIQLKQEQDDRTTLGATASMHQAITQNPDEMARYNGIARKTGFDPLHIATDPAVKEEAERRAKLQDLDIPGLVQTHPRTASALTDANLAALVSDDVPAMQRVEDAFGFFAKSGQAVVSAVPQAAGGLWGITQAASDIFLRPYTRELSRFTGTPDVGAAISEQSRESRQRLGVTTKALMPKAEGVIEAGYYAGLQSLGISALTLPVALVGAPGAALGTMAGTVGGEAYGEAADKGLSPVKALLFGASQAAVEFATEKIPMGKLLKDLEIGTPLYKTLTHQMAREVPGEQVATLVQDLNEWAVLNPDKPFSDYVAQRPSAAAQTLIATIVGTGGTVATAKGLELLTRDRGEAQRLQRSADAYDALSSLSQTAAAAKLRERDPARFKEFMQSMAEDSDLKEVFIDGTKLQNALAQAPVEVQQKFAQDMPEVMAQLGEATTTDGAVRVPVEDYATHIAGTDLDATILPNLRAEASGLSYSEVQEQVKTQTEQMRAEADKELAAQEQDKEYQADAQKVYDTLLTRVEGAKRFSPDANKKYAALQQAYFITKAKKLGIKPSELLAQFNIQVQAEKTGAATELEQRPQTETPEFKAWFGESKVVDAAGKPMVVYHSTTYGDFDAFTKAEQRKGMAGYGFYFSDAKGADIYSKYAATFKLDKSFSGEEKKLNVMPVFLAMRNPLVADNIADVLTPDERRGFGVSREFNQVSPEAKSRLEQMGYDGVIAHEYVRVKKNGSLEVVQPGDRGALKHPVYVVFEPTQIKSATGNIGTFDPNDPNILRQTSSNYGFRAREKARVATLEDFTPDKVGNILRKTNWAILTAENPNVQQLSAEENAQRNADLRADLGALDALGVQFVERGAGFAVTGITRDQAVELGQKYGQQKVVTRDGFVNQDGTVNAAVGVSNTGEVESSGAFPLGDLRTGEMQVEAVHYARTPQTSLTGRIAFYTEGTRPTGEGAFRHELTLGNIYDGTKNPLGFSGEQNAFEAAVIEAGFDGYVTDGKGVLLGDASKDVEVDIPPRPTEYAQALNEVAENTPPAGKLPDQDLADLRRLWSIYAAGDTAAKYGTAQVKAATNSTQDLMKALRDTVDTVLLGEPDISVKSITHWHEGTARLPTGGFAYEITSGKSSAAVYLDMSNRSIQVDVMGWGEGRGGSGVYKAVLDFARANNFVFHGDALGISVAGIKRRLENLLSHALQSGDTSYMLLHPKQIEFIEQETGLRIKWSDDSKKNIEQMLNASYNISNADVPEAQNVYYDFARRDYIARDTGAPADLAGLVAKARRNPDAVRREGAPGMASLKRTIFANTLISARSQEARRVIFDRLARIVLEPVPGTERLLYQSEPAGELTPAFKKWSGGGEVVEAEEVNDYVFEAGAPAVLKVFHGTTHKFSVFDALRGNLEGQFGAINYFTSSYADANDNYAGEGHDLTSRVEQRAERLEQEISDAYIAAGAEGKNTKEAARALKEQFGADVYDIDRMTMARNIARKELHGGESATMELYVKVENPFVIGENAEWLTFVDDEGIYSQAVARVADDEGVTVEEIEANRDDYEDKIDEARWEIEADTPHKLVEAINTVADRYDVKAGDLAAQVYDLGSEAKPADIEALLRASEDYTYAEHPETGDLIQSQLIAEVIQEMGFDSIILRNAETRFKNMNIAQGTAHVHIFDANKSNIKSVQNQGTFDPSNPDIYLQKNRGTFNPDTLTISLLKDADLTTFLHETGHFFLEAEASLASDPRATPEMRADFQKTLDWFGAQDIAEWNSLTFEQKRPYHEKFARGFEAYLFEGKAPSNELRSIFASFKSWLLHVYRSITNLNVELTDEVRGVFDRMLASEDEIAAVQQRAGMTAAMVESASQKDKAAYAALNVSAGDDATDELQRRSLRDMKWLSNAKSAELKKLQREAASKRKEVRAEVTAEVNAEPINQARAFLRKGAATDPTTGDEIKATEGFRMNREIVAQMYPETMLARPDLSKLRGMTEADGLHPDLVADMFGFRSGDALIRELIDGENPRDKVVGLTDQRMLERYGDLVDERAIEQAANEAVHNDARARFMATGLKMLSKSELSVSQIQKAAMDAAEQTVTAKKVRDLHPNRYIVAETRANKEVLKQVAKDPKAAQRAQRSALLNNRLAKAAQDAQEEVRKGVDAMNRTQKAAAQANMRGEYLIQLNELLARFDLRKSTTLRDIDAKRTPLAEWLTEESDRLSAVMPDIPGWILNEANRRHYKDLTVEEFRGLTDTIKQLEMMARREQKQYLEIRGMKFAEERRAILDRIREFHPEAFSLDGEPLGMAPKFVKHFGDKVKDLNEKFQGEFLNAETLVNLLEGGEFGLVHESLLGRMSKQADWKATRLGDIYSKMAPLFGQYSVKERYDFARADIGAPIGMSLTRENALVVALLHGNKEGRERLANYGWSESKQQDIVNLLDERDMRLAEGIWDLFDNNLWPELKELNDRTRGKSPPKVEALEVQHKGKAYHGGYFRLKYDTNLDERAYRLDEGAAVKELLGGGMGMSAKTGQGASTERKQNVTMRPRLDLGVFAEAVSETVHDLAYREAVADTMRMLNDTGIQNTIKTAAGVPTYRALITRVREIAAPPRNPSGFIEKTLSVARKNTVVTLMSGVNTALQNFTGFVSATARVNPGRLAKEIALFYGPQMRERHDFAMEQSEYMRNRHNAFERDLQNEIKKMTVNASIMPDTGAWLTLMSLVDKGTSVPVWNAAFKEGMVKFENDNGKAVDYADHVVRQSQGSGRELDVAQIMSGHGGYGQLKRVFTMFYSYFNAQLGMLVRSGVISARAAKANPARAVARFTKDFMVIVILPAVLTKMIFKGGGDDEDPEEWLHTYGHAIAMYGMAMIPLVRDVGSFAWASFDHDVKNYGYKITPVQSAAEGAVKGAVAARDIAVGEGDDRDLKNLIMGISFTLGLPGKLISDTTLGTKAFLEGEVGPEAVVFGPPKK